MAAIPTKPVTHVNTPTAHKPSTTPAPEMAKHTIPPALTPAPEAAESAIKSALAPPSSSHLRFCCSYLAHLSWRQWLLVVGLLGLITVSLLIWWRNEVVKAYQRPQTLTMESIPALPQLQIGDVILRMGLGTDSLVIAEISNSHYSHVGIVSKLSSAAADTRSAPTRAAPMVARPENTSAATPTDPMRSTSLDTPTGPMADIAGNISAATAVALRHRDISKLNDVLTQHNLALGSQVKVTHATTADDEGSRFEGVITIDLKDFISQATALAIVRFPQLSSQDYPQIQAYLQHMEGVTFGFSKDGHSIYCTELVESALPEHLKLKLPQHQVTILPMKMELSFPQDILNAPQAKLIYQYPHYTSESIQL